MSSKLDKKMVEVRYRSGKSFVLIHLSRQIELGTVVVSAPPLDRLISEYIDRYTKDLLLTTNLL